MNPETSEEVQVQVKTPDGEMHRTWCRHAVIGRKIEIIRDDLGEPGDVITDIGVIIAIVK